jgi:hypothetical protein
MNANGVEVLKVDEQKIKEGEEVDSVRIKNELFSLKLTNI